MSYLEDHLEKIWERQRLQQEFFGLDPDKMTLPARRAAAKDMILGLYEEVAELARTSAHFKAHLLKISPIERGNVADEGADILKYLITILQLFGITQNDLYEAFIRKSEVVEDRAIGERLTLDRSTRVVLCDLDNCVADLREFSVKVMEARGDGPMSDRMLALLEGLKEDFYRGGGFRDLPIIEGAAEGLDSLRRDGYKIVLITARPYWDYKRIYADTLHWLKAGNIAYDMLLFNKDKAEAVQKYIFPAQPVAFIEDRDKHALEIVEIGVPVLLIDYEYNRHISDGPLLSRVSDWPEIVNKLVGLKVTDG